MNRTEQQFFALLRSGLWNTPVDASLFSSDTEWPKILKMATMQTVNGTIFDGISNLPADAQPPVEVMRRLYQTVVRIEQSHAVLNDRLTRLVSMFQAEGINAILLKGQGMARYYPNPLRRQCGDIDLYIGMEDYDRASELVEAWGIVSGNRIRSYKHFHFDWEGVDIELHRIAEKLPDPFKDKHFQRWLHHYLQESETEKWNQNNVDVMLPSAQFNAVYIFNHAFRHFIAGGISFRQLTDWVLQLHLFHESIDKEVLKKDLESFGLLKPWKIFGCIAVNQLGLSKEKFPFYSDRYEKVARKHIVNNILVTGNFGQYDPKRKTRPKSYLPGKLHNFRLKSKRILQLYPIVGGYLGSYYLYFLFIGVRQIVNDKLKA